MRGRCMDFTQIEELRNRLKSLRPLNQTELKRLREEFMIENTYNSNAIEGNTLTLRETALILQEGITVAGKHIREHLEVIGHKNAFEYMAELAEADSVLTERTIRELHSLVLMNDVKNRGVYRSVDVAILGAARTPPPHYLVREQIEQLMSVYDELKREGHIIEAVAEFHLRFENIHPFIDGNGRTGRLVLNLELIKAGFLPVNIKFTDRNKYYDCFDDYSNGRASNALITLLSDYEAAELSKYIAMLEGNARQEKQ
jgi:Fic family protein